MKHQTIVGTRRIACFAALLTLLRALLPLSNAQGKSPAAKSPKTLSRPKLIVLLGVDQMRADYVEKFRSKWTGSLKRLDIQPARPNWTWDFSTSTRPRQYGTTHGTPYYYDQRVPVLFMGYRIQSGEYFQSITPADIAPTLAALCGITLASRDGRVLAEALNNSSARPIAPRPVRAATPKQP